jgi:membrane-bound ClpP family serine protease
MRPLDTYVQKQLNEHAEKIKTLLDADVMAVFSPILPGLEVRVRDAVESFQPRKATLAIVLETQGGIVEVVERMVNTIRHRYQEVIFIIPNRAMSAGTVFVMSGDRILMDYFACLGPIDPQIEKDGRLIPALSYLNQFKRLNEKASQGQLTTAEYALLSKLDLGELDLFEQARELSKELLISWLSTYKFKNWNETTTRKQPVLPDDKKKRAAEIAEELSRNDRWHSHGRAINMKTLVDDLGLMIEDFGAIDGLGPILKEYYELIRDYMSREDLITFVHTDRYF